MTVAVIGLGKIGLPLAVQYAMKGEQVVGLDINQQTVDLVNEGTEPFSQEEHLGEYLKAVVESGNLRASTLTSECVSISDVIVVAVPLFVDSKGNPDFLALDSVTVEIGKKLRKGALISYETTLPIGTTRNRFTVQLENLTGLKVGIDFHVVFSPERVLTGRVFKDLRKYPKIIGGVTNNCSQLGKEFYSRVLDFDNREDLSRNNGVWVLDSCEAAEFVKIAETTYRDVNIGLANQFAKYADTLNLDIYDVICAANSQPFSNIHRPGIAVGGHCIPIYPQFYLWNDPLASIVSAAREANESMPSYAIKKIEERIGRINNERVLIVGVSYRARVKESAFSGSLALRDLLGAMGAQVFASDPLYSDEELRQLGFIPHPHSAEEYACVIIQNEDESNFESLEPVFSKAKLILDGRKLQSVILSKFSEKLTFIGAPQKN